MKTLKLSKAQENKFSTFNEIKSVLDLNAAITSRVPEFANSKAEFYNIINDIENHAVRKTSMNNGASLTKTQKRIELEAVILELCPLLFVYGDKTSNEVVKALANNSVTSLDHLRDTDLTNKATAILNTIEVNKTDLQPFGIDDSDILRLKTSITNYKNSSVEKTNTSTEKTIIHNSLRELFRRGMDILDIQIDRFVDGFKIKEPDFYDSYYAVRTVKKFGVRHRKESEKPELKPVN